jgi:mono/diheme cytochrome c family protein
VSLRRRSAPLLFAGALGLAGCRSTPPPTPLNQLSTEQVAGYNAFQARCAFCHNERTDEAKRGPALAGVFKKPYLPSGAPANDERVRATVLHGHGLMPAQPDIDPDALAALLAYLHTV